MQYPEATALWSKRSAERASSIDRVQESACPWSTGPRSRRRGSALVVDPPVAADSVIVRGDLDSSSRDLRALIRQDTQTLSEVLASLPKPEQRPTLRPQSPKQSGTQLTAGTAASSEALWAV